MRMLEPKPFTFKTEGTRAILLLHGYTGNSADVRMLGRFLEKKGYTSHAPIYRGHGKTPEELLKATPEEWWEDVQAAHKHLVDLGYDEIAVAGLSLGGALGLKLATLEKIKAVITMCTPMFFDNEQQLTVGFRKYATEFKQLERKEDATIKREVDELFEYAPNTFEKVGQFITNVKHELDLVYSPTFVVQARKDQIINTESAPYIHDHIQSDEKKIKWYEKSGHVITLDQEKDQLHEDIYQFLESIDWQD